MIHIEKEMSEFQRDFAKVWHSALLAVLVIMLIIAVVADGHL